MDAILIPVISFGVIGLIVGVVLGIASKIFAIDSDPRIDQVAECLPGANCGGCGYAGCASLAKAIAEGEAPVDACPSLSNDGLKQISKIMGVEAVQKTPMAAFVRCNGTLEKANYQYYFDGTKTCKSVSQLNGGDKSCIYACLGYGDCVQKCQFGALSVQNGVAVVDKEKCTACGLCVKECPKKVIELMPKDLKYYVKCSSQDKGAVVKDKCSTGCIACKICEKNCPADAISVKDNLARIDQSKCIGCGICAEKCPKHIIIKSS